MSPQRSGAGPHAVRLLRDGGIGVLALVYALGFLAWGLHAIQQGLGFLPLRVPQYLSAGVLVSALVVGVTGFQLVTDYVGHRLLRGAPSAPALHRPVVGALVQAVSKAAATLAVVGLALTVTRSVGVFRLEEGGLYFFAGVLALVLGFLEGWILGASLKAGPAPASRPRTTLGGMLGRDALKRSEVRRSERWALAVGASAMLMLVVSGYQLLPGTQPEYGGARPRSAVMEVDAGAFGPQTQAVLFQGPENGTAGNRTAWTVPVLVYYYDDASFLVRAQGRSGGNDPLYEINRAVVYTVVWLD